MSIFLSNNLFGFDISNKCTKLIYQDFPFAGKSVNSNGYKDRYSSIFLGPLIIAIVLHLRNDDF